MEYLGYKTLPNNHKTHFWGFFLTKNLLYMVPTCDTDTGTRNYLSVSKQTIHILHSSTFLLVALIVCERKSVKHVCLNENKVIRGFVLN